MQKDDIEMIFDRILALIMLILLSPLFVIISVALAITSGFPIIFKHKRCGYNFSEFDMYKFRTMKINKGPVITHENDKRITRLGKYLRSFKIDELPQLLNIIKGDMFFVGPRPEVPEIVKECPKYFNYLSKHNPGISDLNSIIFKYEMEIFNIDSKQKYINIVLPFKSKISLLNYSNLSIMNRLSIILLSLLSLINHKISLLIISKYFLPFDEEKTRTKLNQVIKGNLF